jgi:hypothetical protein
VFAASANPYSDETEWGRDSIDGRMRRRKGTKTKGWEEWKKRGERRSPGG